MANRCVWAMRCRIHFSCFPQTLCYCHLEALSTKDIITGSKSTSTPPRALFLPCPYAASLSRTPHTRHTHRRNPVAALTSYVDLLAEAGLDRTCVSSLSYPKPASRTSRWTLSAWWRSGGAGRPGRSGGAVRRCRCKSGWSLGLRELRRLRTLCRRLGHGLFGSQLSIARKFTWSGVLGIMGCAASPMTTTLPFVIRGRGSR